MAYRTYSKIRGTDTRESAGRCSRIRAVFSLYFTWGWLSELLRLGNQRSLEEEDLFSAPGLKKTQELTEKLEKLWVDEQTKSKENGQAPQLWKAVMRVTPGIDYAAYIGKTCVMMFCDIFRPVLLWFLLTDLESDGKSQRSPQYLYVCGIVLGSLIRTYSACHWTLKNTFIATNIKASLIGLVYKKVRTSSKSYMAKVTSGHVTNLASKDLDSIMPACRNFVGLYLTPCYLSSVAFISWKLIGWQAAASVLYAIAVLVYQTGMGKYFYRLRLKTSIVTDQRLRLVADVIAGIRVVKINAWEWVLRSLISVKRRHELSLILQKNAVVSSFRAIASAYLVVTTLIPVVLMVLTEKPLTPQNVFTIMALWSATQKFATIHFYFGIQHVAQTKVVLHRIQEFLLENVDGNQENQEKLPQLDTVDKSKRQDLRGVSAFPKVDRSSSQGAEDIKVATGNVLENIHVRDSNAEDVLELSQITCKWDKTTKENCLNSIHFKACKNQLIGITGPVGSGKSSLLSVLLGELEPTEGQIFVKGSVTYVDQTPWLFSGTVRENILFGQKFNQDHYDKTLQVCELVADLESFPSGDKTVIGERGVILSGGQQSRVCLARSVYHDADIYLLDDPLSAVDATVGQRIHEKCICGALSKRVRVLVTHRVHFLKQADWIYVLSEGSISSQGTYDALLKADEYFAQIAEDDTQNVTNITQQLQQKSTAETVVLEDVIKKHENSSFAKEDRMTGAVSYKTYWQYLAAGISCPLIMLLFFLVLLPEVVSVASSFWLAKWTRAGIDKSQEHYMTVYGVLAGASMFIAFGRSFAFLAATIKSSQNLHSRMLTAILKSPVRFFDTNPAGRILNRFAKDMGGVDEILPMAMLEMVDCSMQVVAALIVASIVNPWVIIAIVPLLGVALYLSNYTLRASRELKRLAAISASPVYAHLGETMRGISTIRVFGQSDMFLDTFYSYQDVFNEAHSLAKIASRWLFIRMDMLSAVVIAAAGFTFIETRTNSAMIGLGISYLLQLTATTTWAFDVVSEVESEMTSVERVMTYTYLSAEIGYENDVTPPDYWPERGTVKYLDVSFAYYEKGPTVLRDLNFTINERERVGIVGRTGAGKSSIVSALLRMPECRGDIVVDGLSINALNIQASRAAIAVIPQNPFLFNGTLRMNMDPSGAFDDKQIWEALEQVQLKPVLQERAAHGGQLDYEITEHGSNLSVGERQLICLARALLQNKKIIVLDEATANVDYKTDQILQSIIRTSFKDRTLLTIAHRLDTVLDYDRIMVLDGGRMVEFDSPSVLLQRKNSHFSKLYGTYRQSNYQSTG